MSFRLLNYRLKGADAPRAGVLADDTVVDAAAGFEAVEPGLAAKHGINPVSTLSILEHWDRALPILAAIADQADTANQAWPLAEISLAAPLRYPNSIFCAGANYQDHFREMAGHDLDKSKVEPYFFLKVARQAVIGPQEEIRKPPSTQKLDWEGEIVAVIGRRGHKIKASDALEHVAGYTIINDLSARDFLWREDWPALRSDWFSQKSFDTSAPMGPWITPRGEIEDVQDLKINTWVNGQLEQDTHSRFMVFTVAELIEALSKRLTLLPGDVIATGTGSGVGHPKGRFLNPGDTCRIAIEGLGEISNPVVAGD